MSAAERQWRGHLFVIDGDLTKLKCDALLVPTDVGFNVTRIWTTILGLPPGRNARLDGLHQPAGWGKGARVVQFKALDAHLGSPTVWLGDIGAQTEDENWYADGAVQFVESATRALYEQWQAPVPPRVALNVVGAGAGGATTDKGRLFRTMIPALHDSAREHSVDVVLVCWGSKQYSAAQRARLRLAESNQAGPWRDALFELGERAELLRELSEDLSRRARANELALFIGAGVSMGAGLPSWGELLDDLLGEAKGLPVDASKFHKLDVRDQAAIVAQRIGSDQAVRDAIRARLGGTRYSLAHGLLASLGAREAVTTNYDQLYEAAVETANRDCAVLPYEPMKGQARWLLKLHGSLDRPEDIVLTRSDYLGLADRAGALFGILQAMLMTRHMLFVGYSLSDDTFHRVMHEVRRARQGSTQEQVGTALVLFDDPLLAELWDDDLRIIAVSDAPGTEPEDRQVAARRLDLFLDLVTLDAAGVSAFLLDPAYASMLDSTERELAQRLGHVSEYAAGKTHPACVTTTRLLGAFNSPESAG